MPKLARVNPSTGMYPTSPYPPRFFRGDFRVHPPRNPLGFPPMGQSLSAVLLLSAPDEEATLERADAAQVVATNRGLEVRELQFGPSACVQGDMVMVWGGRLLFWAKESSYLMSTPRAELSCTVHPTQSPLSSNLRSLIVAMLT